MGPRRRRRAEREATLDTVPPDADALLERVARGDEAAFAQLYDLVAPSVYGLVRRVVRNSALAEEVAQEALVQVWRSATRFDRSMGSATTWILTVAHRRAVDRIRSEEASKRRVERYASEQPAGTALPSETVLDDLDRARVRRALEGLTSAQRQSVELAYYGGYTHVEVAALLDLPLGTVKSRIRDALIRLRGALDEESS